MINFIILDQEQSTYINKPLFAGIFDELSTPRSISRKASGGVIFLSGGSYAR